MPRQSYQRLSPTDIDEIWSRLRSGNSVKPAARALGLPSSTLRTYLTRCGEIGPTRGTGQLVGSASKSVKRSAVAWPQACRCVPSRPAWAVGRRR